MTDQGTKNVEQKIDEADKAGAVQTGTKPNESEGQRREREQREQEKQPSK